MGASASGGWAQHPALPNPALPCPYTPPPPPRPYAPSADSLHLPTRPTPRSPARLRLIPASRRRWPLRRWSLRQCGRSSRAQISLGPATPSRLPSHTSELRLCASHCVLRGGDHWMVLRVDWWLGMSAAAAHGWPGGPAATGLVRPRLPQPLAASAPLPRFHARSDRVIGVRKSAFLSRKVAVTVVAVSRNCELRESESGLLPPLRREK